MKLGAHNSFTYLKPKYWYGWIIRFTAKCQEVDIYEQYEKYGVRVFDFRIRKGDDGKVELAHGLVAYKNSADELNRALRYLDEKGDSSVKIALETRTFWQKSNEQSQWFINYCSMLEKEFEHIYFYGGKESSSGDSIYIFRNKALSSDGYHASWATKTKLDDIYPRAYAKRNNKKWYEKGTDKDVMFLDFVNLND